MKNKFGYRFALIMASMIWGFAFAFQTMGIEHIGAFYFNGLRLLIAFICLIPVYFGYNFITNKSNNDNVKIKVFSVKQIVPGIMCGIVLGVASTLQQYGLYYTSAGKSSFITALYIIMVPLIGIFMNKKPSLNVVVAVPIAILGMYFLCIKEGFKLNFGDVLTFLCAIFFAIQIILIDKYSPSIHPIILSMTQFLIASLISFGLAWFKETISLNDIRLSIVPLLYAGVASGAVAYTLQIIGQRKTPPTLASLLMSGESVFGAIGGFLILGQRLSAREIIGCIVVFSSIIIAQIPCGSGLKYKQCCGKTHK